MICLYYKVIELHKVIQFVPDVPNPVIVEKVISVFESRLNMPVITIGEDGYTIIQPILFLYQRNHVR